MMLRRIAAALALMLSVTTGAAVAQMKVPAAKVPLVVEKIVGAPWTGAIDEAKNGVAVYVLHWRKCPYCRKFDLNDRPKLLAAGVDIRMIPFPADGDATTDEVAFVAMKRDRTIYERFNRGQPTGYTKLNSSQAQIDAIRAVLDSITAAQSVLGRQWVGTPVFFYQDQKGDWHALSGYGEPEVGKMRTALLARAASAARTPNLVEAAPPAAAPATPKPSPTPTGRTRPVF